jgi:type IV pilus assembly protein PilB
VIPKEIAKKHMVVPVHKMGRTLAVAMADPSNIGAIDEIKFATNMAIEVVVASERSIAEKLAELYSGGAGPSQFDSFEEDDAPPDFVGEDFESVEEEEEEDEAFDKSHADAPVVKMVNYILHESIRRGASDIHFEPYEKSFRVRIRVDGTLIELIKPPSKMKLGILSRIKILSKLDIAAKRRPQDGRIKLKMRGRPYDFRVNTMPTLFGEKAVLRILDTSALDVPLEKLGFEKEQMALYTKHIKSPYGMVLVCGPTGSGKSTTLYAGLRSINSPDINISTVENPVEFNIAGINQLNTNDKIGLDFSSALRAFLRQDPDVILIGEIRDPETAGTAVKAALTGHLVLSTLHTNDAVGTIQRLMFLDIEKFLITSAVNLIIAQRLLRKVCEFCRETETHEASELEAMGLPQGMATGTVETYKEVGCAECNGTGYKGRVAIHEIFEMTDGARELILTDATERDLKIQALKDGMITLRISGLRKVLQGLTSVHEVLSKTTAG